MRQRLSPKSFRVLFFLFLFVADFVVSYWVIMAAYEMRIGLLPPGAAPPPRRDYAGLAYLFAVLNVYFLYAFGTYKDTRGRSGIDEFFGVAKSSTVSLLVLMASTFFYREYEYSRLVIVYSFAIAYFMLGVSRCLVTAVERRMLAAGHGRKKLMFIGTGGHFETLVRKVLEKPGTGYTVLGYLEEDHSGELAAVPLLGSAAEMEKFVEHYEPDEVIVTLKPTHHHLVEAVVDVCDRRGIECTLSPDLVGLMAGPRKFDEISGVPLIRVRRLRARGFNAFVKRAFDLAVSAALIVLAAPLFVVVGVLIKLDSRGPVFYLQKRVGMDGVEYWMFKFRSMEQGAEENGPAWSRENDPRVTRVGRLLRATSLDETPQLFNVLMGQMSIVGPRPERPHFVEKFEKGIARYMERHKVKAGMTGWAQVNGLRGDTSIEERVRYDMYYIENWSLAFDVKIVILTVLTIGQDVLNVLLRR
ncbi:MAG: undecaprenyl-phosphate glucose phosphotransferase [bacterium]